jgi:hypothetical protein
MVYDTDLHAVEVYIPIRNICNYCLKYGYFLLVCDMQLYSKIV